EQIARRRLLPVEAVVDEDDVLEIGGVGGHGCSVNSDRPPARGYAVRAIFRAAGFRRRDGGLRGRTTRSGTLAAGPGAAAVSSGRGHSARSLQPLHSPPRHRWSYTPWT